MDYSSAYTRVSDDMAIRTSNANTSGRPDDEAQLFTWLESYFVCMEMNPIRLSEVPKLFQVIYSKPLTTKRNLIDIFRSPNDFALICTVKQTNDVIWVEPTPQFIEVHARARQAAFNTFQENLPPSAAETEAYVQQILPEGVPLENTPHYKMFVIEFSETLRQFFEDIDMGIEDHTILLWLYLVHLFITAKKKYRVSVSELPELFREFYGTTLDLPDKLVTTLQEDCYLVCQVEKFKQDVHITPSQELVHFLSTVTGEELQLVISHNLEILQDRHYNYSSDEDSSEDEPVKKTATKKQQTKHCEQDSTTAQQGQ
eukprot:TRINITY_DN4431_c0_g1_i1.p1 TRINITY_DN4431_c0_g1~~TRINITY_DN4431_c0_g1_i1.p1  ORF type:complete len:314 (-),score=37.31 TRINITY_DN4431_c0_g1_i1:1141-2082(-)